jgi:hypothetical protein
MMVLLVSVPIWVIWVLPIRPLMVLGKAARNGEWQDFVIERNALELTIVQT